MRRGSLSYDRQHVARARELRAEMGASERVLWERIRKEALGFRFKRQVPVGEYVLDFYCPEAALCVEVDGELHAERGPADASRDAFLDARRIKTMRIASMDLFDPRGLELTRWLERIQKECERRSGRPAYKLFEDR